MSSKLEKFNLVEENTLNKYYKDCSISDSNSLLTGLLRCLKGLRNGFYTGGKIRFFHSLVAIFLLSKGSLKKKIKDVIKNTYTHAKNVGIFVFIYKAVNYLLELVASKKYSWFPLIGGFLAGYVAFHSDTPINRQITLYALSRVIFAMLKKMQISLRLAPFSDWFPFISAVAWGSMLFLFESERVLLPSSLRKVFDYIYKESERWDTWKDFFPIDFSFLYKKFK